VLFGSGPSCYACSTGSEWPVRLRSLSRVVMPTSTTQLWCHRPAPYCDVDAVHCRQWEHLLFSSLLVSKPMWLLHGGTVSGVIAGRESVLSEHAHARTRALNLQVRTRPCAPQACLFTRQPCMHTRPTRAAADASLHCSGHPSHTYLIPCAVPVCPLDGVAVDCVQQWHVACVCVKPEPDCRGELAVAATR
jgi:hypothetical protein